MIKTDKKITLITGISGQDGSYLAELLLNEGHEVHGIVRRSSSSNTFRIDHILDKLHLHYGDIIDSMSVDRIMEEVKPNYVAHLAAQSHVRISFDVPAYTCRVDAEGTLNMLEAMKKYAPTGKFYNAATSELFGKVQEIPQTENTPFYPRSPYSIAKLYAYWMVKNYRESFGMFAVNGILFNHESERRGDNFVTKKITLGLANYLKTGETLYLGNLDSRRDWGYAKDYVEGMWMMLQQNEPDDYILATGQTHSIKDFIEECMNYLKNRRDFSINWQWKKDDKNRDILWDNTYNKLVIGINDLFYRPAEVDILLGDATKAKEKLGWEPKTKFSKLVELMMQYDLK